MNLRFLEDAETGLPHINDHGVTEDEVRDILTRPGETRPGTRDSRVASGQTATGRFLRVIYTRDPEPSTFFVITAYELTGKAQMKRKQKLPPGWDEQRIREVLDHYENQTDDEAVAEDEAAYKTAGQTMLGVPTELVPGIIAFIERKLHARRKRKVSS